MGKMNKAGFINQIKKEDFERCVPFSGYALLLVEPNTGKFISGCVFSQSEKQFFDEAVAWYEKCNLRVSYSGFSDDRFVKAFHRHTGEEIQAEIEGKQQLEKEQK